MPLGTPPTPGPSQEGGGFAVGAHCPHEADPAAYSRSLARVVAGGDTEEPAGRMFVSPNTGQDHLKSIFAKTAARSRRALLARAVGG
ncbi:MAG: hypothetical protein NVSMB13_13420 [Mycobacteriales bacterium]